MTRKPYVREIPNTWWLKNNFYKAYMMREISSVFITIYSVVLLVGFFRLYQGPEAYQGWLEALQNPWSIAASVVMLLSTLYHSISWFKLAPQAMPLQFGKIRVIPGLVVGLHYLAFLAILAVVFFAISL
ncbi:MAG: fumarate reductase subunit C [Gammaproteobacteria bacterium]|nr:fumarate reductase subunit C [Gammaproteobacteria bacterium]